MLNGFDRSVGAHPPACASIPCAHEADRSRCVAALDGLGQFAAAESLAREALAMRRVIHETPHPDVAESLSNVGRYRERKNEWAAADSLYREALSIYEATLPAGDRRTQAVLQRLVMLYEAWDQPQQAARYRDRTVADAASGS